MGCTARTHEDMKASPAAFVAGTIRLPHHQHAEAVADGLWFRNCACCRSTLVLVVEGETAVAA